MKLKSGIYKSINEVRLSRYLIDPNQLELKLPIESDETEVSIKVNTYVYAFEPCWEDKEYYCSRGFTVQKIFKSESDVFVLLDDYLINLKRIGFIDHGSIIIDEFQEY